MLTRSDRHGLFHDVHAREVVRDLVDVLQSTEDRLATEVTKVEQHATVDAAAFLDLRSFGAGHDVTGGELFHLRSVGLHEPVAFGVEQVCTLSTGRFREQHAVASQRRRVVLDHLHVKHRRAGSVGERHAVAGADERVRGRLEGSPYTACR